MMAVTAISLTLGLGTGSVVGTSSAGAMTQPLTTAAGSTAESGTGAAITSARPSVSPLAVATPQLSYLLVEANGMVEPLGGAAYYGSVFGTDLVAPIVALLSTPDRRGYWLVGVDGSMYPFGDARNEGGAGGEVRQDPVVAAAVTPDGAGYWLVTSSGQVTGFGDARNYGSISTPLRAHVIGMAATSDGKGYWIACSTGGVFNFGDARLLTDLQRRAHPGCRSSLWPPRPTAGGTGSPTRTGSSSASATPRTFLPWPPSRPSSASRSRPAGPVPGWPNKTAP